MSRQGTRRRGTAGPGAGAVAIAFGTTAALSVSSRERPSSSAPRSAGCSAAQVVYAATSADVTDVVVGGEHVVAGGQHRLGDVGSLLHDAIAAVRR